MGLPDTRFTIPVAFINALIFRSNIYILCTHRSKAFYSRKRLAAFVLFIHLREASTILQFELEFVMRKHHSLEGNKCMW